MTDPVRPGHYHRGSGHEVIDAIAAWGLDFDRGNVVKYVARAGLKGCELEDLRKAAAYLQHAIARLEKATAPAQLVAEPCDRCDAPHATHGLGQYLLCGPCFVEAQRGVGFVPSVNGAARAAAREAGFAEAMRQAR